MSPFPDLLCNEVFFLFFWGARRGGEWIGNFQIAIEICRTCVSFVFTTGDTENLSLSLSLLVGCSPELRRQGFEFYVMHSKFLVLTMSRKYDLCVLSES